MATGEGVRVSCDVTADPSSPGRLTLAQTNEKGRLGQGLKGSRVSTKILFGLLMN